MTLGNGLLLKNDPPPNGEAAAEDAGKCGVWASDYHPLLSQFPPLPSYMVVNMHTGNQPGAH